MNNLLSVDIGYQNMALVELLTDFNNFTVESVHKINLKDFNETLVHKSMIKFICKYSDLFDRADIILIERQPPLGLTNIQDILAFKYSNKVKLICPRSMHKHFMLSSSNYDLRKKQTESIADKYIVDNNIYNTNERKHDMADAFCQGLYYIEKNKVAVNKVYDIPSDLNNFFDSFSFKR